MGQSMGEVDKHSVETARLSGRVVELAESGRTRMRRSSEGMESIRSATEDVQNPAQIRILRRNIARLKTALRERKQG